MADVRKPLTEEDLRDAKDFLTKSIADQGRDLGIALPDIDHQAKVAEKVVRKVEVDQEDERRKDLVRPVAMDINRPPGRYMPEGVEELEPEEIGTVEFGPDGVVLLPGHRMPVKQADDPEIDVRRRWFQMLRTIPLYRARIEKIIFSQKTVEEKARAYEDIFEETVTHAKKVTEAARRAAEGH